MFELDDKETTAGLGFEKPFCFLAWACGFFLITLILLLFPFVIMGYVDLTTTLYTKVWLWM